MKTALEITQRMICTNFVFDRAILEMSGNGIGQYSLGLQQLDQLSLFEYLEGWENEFMHTKIGEGPAELYNQATYMGETLFSLQWMLNLVPTEYDRYFETVFPIIFYPKRFFSEKKDNNFHQSTLEEMKQFLNSPPALKDEKTVEQKWKMLTMFSNRISLWRKGNKEGFDFRSYLSEQNIFNNENIEQLTFQGNDLKVIYDMGEFIESDNLPGITDSRLKGLRWALFNI